MKKLKNIAILNMWFKGLVLCLLLVASFQTFSQNMSINDNGAAPDPSAMLDISDTTKGFLPPRMNTTQMNNISSPASGLFLYNTDSLGYMYYNGSAWLSFGSRNTLGDTLSTNIYNASILSAGNVGSTNVDWIQNVNRSSGGTFDITFKSGIFTESPTIVVSCGASTGGHIASYNSLSQNGVTVYLTSETGATVNKVFSIVASKVGADFKQNSVNGVLSSIDISSSQLPESVVDSTRIIDTDGDTKIQVEENTNDDIIRFDNAGTETFTFQEGKIGVFNGGNSVFIGRGAGSGDDLTATNNIGIGDSALSKNTGNGNVSIGANSMFNNIAGQGNVTIGEEALFNNSGGNSNVAIGRSSQRGMTSGGFNVAIGANADGANTTGSSNVIIGTEAGFNFGSSNTKSGSVFLGFQSGYAETSSNKLYIENGSSSTPLIYGDFAADSLVFNGRLTLDSAKNGTGYTFPGVRGNVGQTLISNGAGAVSWGTASGGTSLWTASATDIYFNSGGIAVGATSLTAGYKQEIAVTGGGAGGGGLLINNNASGNNLKTGIEINLSSGGNDKKYGTITKIIGKNNSADSLFGHYSEITPEDVAAPSFAYKSKFLGTDGTTYGFYSENEDYNYFSGNVGIGVAAPTALLELNNAINPRKVSFFTMADNDHQFLGFGTGFGELRYQVDQTTTDHVFYSGTSATTSAELMRIEGDGNVGIGTNSPSELLHISKLVGDAILLIESDTDNNDENDNPRIQFVQDGGAVSGFLGFEGTGGVTITNSISNAFLLSTINASPFQFAINSTLRMTLSSDGNLGIGTSTPEGILSIVDNGNSNPGILLSGFGDAEGDIAVLAGEQLQIGHWDGTTSTNRITMDTDGNLEVNEELQTNETADFHMLPIGMASFNISGTSCLVRTGTGNITCSYNGTGNYTVTVSGHSASMNNDIVQATITDGGTGEISISDGGAGFNITIRPSSGIGSVNRDFSIIIYSEND